MTHRRLPQAGRAAALVATAAVLLATSRPYQPRLPLDAATTCGPAAAVTLVGPEPGGCGAEHAWTVDGGAAAGLPVLARQVDDTQPDWARFVLIGPVELPGTEPPVTVRRICQVSAPDARHVRTLTCEGEVPEAACDGTLTARPEPTP